MLKLNQKTFIETLAKRFDVTTTARYPASPSARAEDEGRVRWYVALKGGRGLTDVAGRMVEAGNL